MLFSTARSEVRERLGETSADFWSDAFINRNLNEGLRRFLNEERWTWLRRVRSNISITAGNPEFTLEPDVDVSRQFALALRPSGATDDSQLLLPKRVQPDSGYVLRRRYPNQGSPAYYYIVRAQTTGGSDPAPQAVCRLIPTPDRAYTAEYTYYYHQVADLTDGDDISAIIPRQYVEAPIAWATGMCWLKELNGSGKAQEQFNIYNAILAQAKKNEEELSVDEPVIWGGEEPQLQRRTLEEALLARIGVLG